MKKQSGFTLIELLLVLAIIGIISAIAIPALLGQRQRAKAKAVGSMVANVAGECARVSDTLKENSTAAVTAQNVVDAVLSLDNYKFPAAKNPYGGNSAAYVSGNTTGLGIVGLSANDSYSDPAITGHTFPAVIIRGSFTDPSTNAGSTTLKVVALD